MGLWYALIGLLWGWEVVGPERGHVLDADVGQQEVLVTTRVGVMRSSPSLTQWERDSRFPPDTKRVAVWDGGAWAAPPTQLWEIGTDTMRLVSTFPKSVVVDLDAQEDGTLFAGVRGGQKGVWRVTLGGGAQHVLTNVEPWTILAEGQNVWVGTIKSGLWLSEQGQPFQQMTTGSIASIEKVGERIWVGLPDGRILDARSHREIVRIEGGFASTIAALDQNRAFLTIISPTRKAHPFQVFNDGELTEVTKLRVDEDGGFIGPTGAWSLRNGQALVGSFRRGPLRWDGKLSVARTGFHATVSGGGALDKWGRLVMAFMGTGVYRWQNGEIYPHPMEGPVTDSIAVKSVLGQIVVLDFEGINLLDEEGEWRRVDSVPDKGKRIRNSLRDVAKSTEDIWWGLDHYGRLWMKATEQWERCTLRNGIRFDGDGSTLLVATEKGYARVDCQENSFVHTQIGNIKDSRSLGEWVAISESLFYQDRIVDSISEGKVDALVADGDGVLLSVRNAPLLRCETVCEEVAPALAEPILALGRLPDERIWALEQKGTLLFSDDSENAPPAWWTFTEYRVRYSSFMQLYSNPWMQNKNTAEFQFLRWPEWPWLWVVVILVPVGLIAGWRFFRVYQKK